ncbi:AP-5 complex subunit beta-1 [Melia azedarach]|uniref:AP-5 complex subunit beta-1 n=1 Tax=Melia azedarach TaxID=155640 RepID=A0ACC1XHE1_MELAZ|nr:AP-5 complex subunit beta-1 [Melia azedarach]
MMTDRAGAVASKPLSWQDWEALIEDFQNGGARLQRWTSDYQIPSLVDLALSSLLKKEFPQKLALIIFLEEFCLTFFSNPKPQNPSLDRLIETLRFIVQSPVDNIHITYGLKDQVMISTTSILISLDAFHVFDIRYIENVVELLLTVINRPNHGLDRHTRAIAGECLRQFEVYYPCLFSDIAGHLWTLCQSERTHASQSYILLFTAVIYNIVKNKLNVPILNTPVPLVPFSIPQWSPGSNSGLNYKELRRAMAFLLEWTQVLTPCGMLEFLRMIMPVAVVLELQPSMLKVQFFGMIYSFDPVLCHTVLMMHLHFFDAFDGQEYEIVQRLMLVSKEAQHYLVFRLLVVHWLLGLLNKLMSSREAGKKNSILELGLRFYLSVFDPLALKALKLDLLAFCTIFIDMLRSESIAGGEVADGKTVVKRFEDSLVSISAFKWLPPSSTETAVAFRTFHKFLIGASSHLDTDPSTTRILMKSAIFHALQGMVVDMTLEFQRLVPVIVAFVDRLLGCQKHRWLGEHLLQKIDEHLLPRVNINYRLVSYFPIFDRIAENDTIPPRGLLELLTKFTAFLVQKHGPDTGLKSWSQGSRVLGNCRTMLMYHQSSRLFIGLSRLLAFTCLYFPDLEIRDHARIYLRLLICVPGKKLRSILNLGKQLLGVAPSPHSSSFFNVQSPRHYQDIKKSKNVSSCVHVERMVPLLVKQFWSLSLSTAGDKSGFSDSIRDTKPAVDEREHDDSVDYQIMAETEKIDQPLEPLRVMDAKISEILEILRRHFSCIPDFRHMAGLKVRIACSLRFESEPFNRLWGGDSSVSGIGVDSLPAIYATVLKFSSSAPYGAIPSCHIPFLLGEPARKGCFPDQMVSLNEVPVDNGSREKDSFRAPVTIVLEPQEPTPGLVDVFIETNAESGQIIYGQLRSITVGIEDMFLKAIVPPNIIEDDIPAYYLDLFNALWEACGTSSNTGRETFSLKGGKGVAAINGIQSVKLLEVPADSLIWATQRYLAPFVVSVIGEQLINTVKDGGIISDIIWKDVDSDSFLDGSTSVTDVDRGPLHLTYIGDEDEREGQVNISKRNMGCFLILIFLPPRFHLLFRMEVCDVSTLVRIRTDHWPCLAYIDDYLEALFST